MNVCDALHQILERSHSWSCSTFSFLFRLFAIFPIILVMVTFRLFLFVYVISTVNVPKCWQFQSFVRRNYVRTSIALNDSNVDVCVCILQCIVNANMHGWEWDANIRSSNRNCEMDCVKSAENEIHVATSHVQAMHKKCFATFEQKHDNQIGGNKLFSWSNHWLWQRKKAANENEKLLKSKNACTLYHVTR